VVLEQTFAELEALGVPALNVLLHLVVVNVEQRVLDVLCHDLSAHLACCVDEIVERCELLRKLFKFRVFGEFLLAEEGLTSLELVHLVFGVLKMLLELVSLAHVFVDLGEAAEREDVLQLLLILKHVLVEYTLLSLQLSLHHLFLRLNLLLAEANGHLNLGRPRLLQHQRLDVLFFVEEAERVERDVVVFDILEEGCQLGAGYILGLLDEGTEVDQLLLTLRHLSNPILDRLVSRVDLANLLHGPQVDGLHEVLLDLLSLRHEFLLQLFGPNSEHLEVNVVVA